MTILVARPLSPLPSPPRRSSRSSASVCATDASVSIANLPQWSLLAPQQIAPPKPALDTRGAAFPRSPPLRRPLRRPPRLLPGGDRVECRLATDSHGDSPWRNLGRARPHPRRVRRGRGAAPAPATAGDASGAPRPRGKYSRSPWEPSFQRGRGYSTSRPARERRFRRRVSWGAGRSSGSHFLPGLTRSGCGFRLKIACDSW